MTTTSLVPQPDLESSGPGSTSASTKATPASWRERYRVSALSGRGSVFAPRVLLLVAATLLVMLYGLSATSSLRYSIIVGIVLAVAVLGNNAITGLLGEINLGAGAFVALGAYTFAYLLSEGRSVLFAALVAVVASMVVGAVLAVPTTRLTGIFTALVTFALAATVHSVVMELSEWTGGQRGIAVPFDATVLGYEVTGSNPELLFLVTVVFLVAGLVALGVLRSRIGRTLFFIGEAPQAAECFGVATRRWEVGIWSVAAGLGGLCGCLYALAVNYLTPEVFPFFLSISLLVACFVGGPRSPLGALLGGLFIGSVPTNIQNVIPAEASGMLFGAAMFLMLFAGGLGLAGMIERAPIAVRRLIGGQR